MGKTRKVQIDTAEAVPSPEPLLPFGGDESHPDAATATRPDGVTGAGARSSKSTSKSGSGTSAKASAGASSPKPLNKASKAKSRQLRRQVAALPFRRTDSGKLEILIITSRETRRFVIPKGWPMKKRRKYEAAAVEAFEEAGVKGAIEHKPVGRYTYWKRLKDAFTLVRVVVYALEVKEQAAEWPERDERLLSWLPPLDAAILVDEPGLAKIIREFKRGR